MENYLTSASLQMPKILYGTAWKKDNTKNLVLSALDSGFTGIDTACQPRHYNQALVGEAVAEFGNRDSLFIQTKYTPFAGQDPSSCPYDRRDPIRKQVEVSVETSLSELKVDRIDSLLLHSPLETFDETIEAWNTLEKFVERGVIGQLGISNCYGFEYFKKFYETVMLKPSVLQNRFYRETAYDKKQRSYCLEHNVVYQSFWSLTANLDVLETAEIITLAQKYQTIPAVVFFRYLVEQSIAPLIGTTNRAHMEKDLTVFDFSLEYMEIQSIQNLLDKLC